MAWYQYSVDRFTKQNTGSSSSVVINHTFEVITEIEPWDNTKAKIRFKLRNISTTLGGCVYVHFMSPPINTSNNEPIYFVNLKPSGYSWPAKGATLDLGNKTVEFTLTKKATDKCFQMFPCEVYLAPECHSTAPSQQSVSWEDIRQLHAAAPNDYRRGKWTLFAPPPGNCDIIPDTVSNVAARWTAVPDISPITYKDTTKTNNSQSHNKVKVTVQYNPNTATPEYVDVRFKLEKVNSNDATNYYDGMYILFNGNGVGGDGEPKLLTLKGYAQSNDNWIFYSPHIRITKAYNAAYFRLQEFHICNHQDLSDSESEISLDNFITLYYGDKAVKKAYRTAVNAQNFSIPNTVATAIQCSTPYAIDEKNNTFSLVIKNLYAGTLNPIESIRFTYQRITDPEPIVITGVLQNLSEQKFGPYELLIDTTNKDKVNYLTTNTQRVYITLDVIGKYNSFEFSTQADINCYTFPIMDPSNAPQVIEDSWDTCHFYWNAVNGSNSNSPLKGYTVSLYKVADATEKMLHLRYSDKKICCGTVSNPTYLNFEATSNISSNPYLTAYEMDLQNPTVYININSFITAEELVPGDRLKIAVKPYSYPNTIIGKLEGNLAVGPMVVVQEPPTEPTETKGTLKVFTSERSWETGQVYVKIDSATWVAAEAIYVYTDEGWQISE